MIKLRFASGASFAILATGCAFLGYTGAPLGIEVPEPSATPTPAQTASPTPVPGASASPAAGDAAKGQTLYASKCLSCHNANGKGMGVDVGKESFGALKAKQAGSMASYMSGLSDSDVRDLEAYLAAL